MVTNAHKHILIAPLDWGMGHTTRCIPIMQYLLLRGHSVLFAGNEWQRNYIKESFAGIETIHLDGYNVSYGKTGNGFMLNLAYQMPRLLKTIKQEQSWLANLVQERKIDAVISDNRYGLYHNHIPCVLMTHQLLVQSGFGNIADNILRRVHYKYIEQFGACWVVDVANSPNLSGKLAHPDVLPSNAHYIGLLSQMNEARSKDNEEYLLILLSGPEPQRSILSGLLWQQVVGYPHKVIFVEGSTTAQQPEAIPHNVQWYGQVTKQALEPLLQKASMVISRSGYSTLMDMVVMKKKAIIIATPGQTEQEYLALHLHNQGVYFQAVQKSFNLTAAMEEIKSFPFHHLALEGAGIEYQCVIDKWLDTLQANN